MVLVESSQNYPIYDPLQVKILLSFFCQYNPLQESVVDLGFSPGALTAVDIVAANVAARRFAVGSPRRMKNWSQLSGAWRLALEEETAQQGVLSAIDHEVALMHLLQHLKTQGYELAPDQWLLTGALKGMKPAQRGVYILKAGSFETLKLRLR